MSFDFITFIRDKTGFGNDDYALDVRAVQVVGGDSYVTINGQPVVTGGGGGAAAWSEYPATQNVTVTGYDLDVNTITGLGGNMVQLSATQIDGANVLTLDGNPITGSQILYGSIPPGLTAGAANDTYINTTNGDVYSKVSSTEWISTSSSSLPWSSVASDSTGQFLAACVVNQKIWRSDNAGGIWVESDAPSAYWRSIASDSSGAKLVACVSGGKIWTSINYGLTWSESNSETRAWSSVASSSNGQVLLACVEGASIYVSLNSGEDWIESDAPPLAWTSIACNSSGTLCVACASGGKIWTSIDGQSWTETSSPTSSWTSVTASSGQFLLACVSYGTIWRSVDGGSNWTETGSPPNSWSSVKCTPDETKLIASVEDGGIWTSIDAGVTWVESDAPSLPWKSVTSDSTGTKLVACATGEPIYTNSGGWALELNITGPTGSAGATGADGQSSSYFDYRADSDIGDPASGHISWESDPQLDSTFIKVNHINQDGVDIDIFLNLVQEGNTLIIQDKNVSANFQKWLVSGTPILNEGSNYVQYPVTLVTSGGSAEFADNHPLILATIVPGPPGPPGAAGATGATGATGPMNPGLYNKLQIVPVATPTSSTVVWSSLPAPTAPIITNPNTWVWDSSTSSPTVGTGNSWRFSKTALQTTSISWAMFSQVAGMTASGPPPSPSIPKNTLEAVYFLIKPTINIATTPANTNPLTLNIYSYSGTGFFNTRWGYNILGTGTTLVAGYTYLLYAFDVAVTSTGANGTIVPPTQTTFLRDPYDIYTNIPHIGMQNVVTSGSVSAGYDSAPITVIAINSTAGLITGGVDFIITKCGYKVGGTNVEYTLNFT